MQKSARLICFFSIFILFSNCKNEKEKQDSYEVVLDTVDTSSTPILTENLNINEQLLGKFSGEIPCTQGCESTEIMFELFKDGTYTLNQLSYNVNVIPKTFNGNWTFDEKLQVYALKSDQKITKYRLTKSGNLIQLDKNNKDLSPESADFYVFIKLKK